MVTPDQNSIPARLFNFSNEQVKLRRNTKIAKLTVVHADNVCQITADRNETQKPKAKYTFEELKIDIDPNLDEKTKGEIRGTIIDYLDIFAKDNSDLTEESLLRPQKLALKEGAVFRRRRIFLTRKTLHINLNVNYTFTCKLTYMLMYSVLHVNV
jgi:hypothetical protein